SYKKSCKHDTPDEVHTTSAELSRLGIDEGGKVRDVLARRQEQREKVSAIGFQLSARNLCDEIKA
ncbi:MAG TPA: hypothetical protein VGK58_22835, partial [Lacipirellulaceae bacterium]